jgi:hypothetical protein
MILHPAQLPFNKIREPVFFNLGSAQIFRAPHHSDTLLASAVAVERLAHVPLGRWIEKSKFIASCHGPYGNELHSSRVEKTIGVATVVGALEAFGEKFDMLVLGDLHREVSGFRLNILGEKSDNHFVCVEGFFGEEGADARDGVGDDFGNFGLVQINFGVNKTHAMDRVFS